MRKFLKTLFQIEEKGHFVLFEKDMKKQDLFPKVDLVIALGSSSGTQKFYSKEIKILKEVASAAKSLIDDKISKKILFSGGKKINQHSEWKIMHDWVYPTKKLNLNITFSNGKLIKEKGEKALQTIKRRKLASTIIVCSDRDSASVFGRILQRGGIEVSCIALIKIK